MIKKFKKITKYKKVKAKLALLEAGRINTQSPEPFQSKNKGLVVETFDWDEEEVSDDEEMEQVKVLMALADDELVVGKPMLEMLTEASSKNDVNKNAFIPAFMDYDHEMIPKSKDWVERHNPDYKLPNFNTGRILVPESQAVNENLGPTKAPTNLESYKESRSKPQTPLPSLKVLREASPSSEVMPLTYQEHSLRERPGL
nr:hypothetical protein [Tanacetum cinerariifolium]